MSVVGLLCLLSIYTALAASVHAQSLNAAAIEQSVAVDHGARHLIGLIILAAPFPILALLFVLFRECIRWKHGYAREADIWLDLGPRYTLRPWCYYATGVLFIGGWWRAGWQYDKDMCAMTTGWLIGAAIIFAWSLYDKRRAVSHK